MDPVSLLPEADLLTLWLLQYGSFVLFVMLSLGIILLPIPEETLMVVAGILMHNGKLNIPLTVLFSYAGVMCGISTSYLLGRTAGNFVLGKYGKWFGITEEKRKKAHQWFSRLGKWLLFVGYFIPGVRHLSGISAGTANMKFSQFALFAFSGAILWVSIFLSLGYFLGPYCLECYEKLEEFDLITIGFVILAIFISVVVFKKVRAKIRQK